MFKRPHHQRIARVIDLAMMNLQTLQLLAALDKATEAYGPAIARDLAKAIDRIQNRQGWLERCMQAMAMNVPKAVIWKKIRNLKQVLPLAG